MVSAEQYIQGMIPHHSMAIYMSKKVLDKNGAALNDLARSIITSQEAEIKYMKQMTTPYKNKIDSFGRTPKMYSALFRKCLIRNLS